MTQRNDGGPAFPVPDGEAADRGFWGMSLRDHYAIEALKGIGTWMPDYEADGDRVEGTANLCNPSMQRARARWAYNQADAMLEEREK